jgi:hypothetical protein
MCKGNFDFDRDVDSSDAALFKKHFGRSMMKNPCPSDGPAPAAKTGQTTSYENYDDGYYQKGVEPLPKPRFSDHGNGTVTDNLTGLMWTKNANLAGGEIPTLQDALDYVSNMNQGEGTFGYKDWRIPNVKEIFSLLDCEEFSPPLPPGHPFINIQHGSNVWLYWTSTTYTGNLGCVWCWCAYGGSLDYCGKSGDALITFLWPVRGGH